MWRTILVALISLFLIGNSSDNSSARLLQKNSDKNFAQQPDTLEKLTVASGTIILALDLNRLNGLKSREQSNTLRFSVAPDSFFTILVFDGVLRGAELGSMGL